MNSVVDVKCEAPNMILLDNGGEFVNNKMLAVCEQEPTVPTKMDCPRRITIGLIG